MKKFGFMFTAILSILLLTSADYSFRSVDGAHIEFETVNHDYGVMQVGANGSFSFKFKNTGNQPLIIQDVRSSCGCTVAKKPDAPIMPGATESITVRYDTNRLGVFHKTISVSSNADNANIVLTIKGEVKPKPQEVAPVKTEQQGFTPTNQ